MPPRLPPNAYKSSGWSFKRRPGTMNERGTQHGLRRRTPAPRAFFGCDHSCPPFSCRNRSPALRLGQKALYSRRPAKSDSGRPRTVISYQETPPGNAVSVEAQAVQGVAARRQPTRRGTFIAGSCCVMQNHIACHGQGCSGRTLLSLIDSAACATSSLVRFHLAIRRALGERVLKIADLSV